MLDQTHGGTGAGPESRQEFLAFSLGDQEYGIPIRQVQELRGYETVTHIANAPAFIKGVINLRGAIVPIVDLRIRFGIAAPSYDQFTVVVILQLDGRLIGVVVDGVSDVTALAPEQVKPAPSLGTAMDTGCLTGIGTAGEQLLLLLDIGALLTGDELGLLRTMTAQ